MSNRKQNGAHQARQLKKEQFQSTVSKPTGKNRTAVLIAVIAVLSVAALYVIFGSRQSGGALSGQLKAAGAPGQDVRIPIAEVNDGKAKFYNYTLADDQKISFFVVKSSDGIIRAAFNACDVCYEKRRGYHQEGDDLVCNNCGRHFPSNSVNEVKGGCNPAPLERTVEGDHLVIKARDLQQGAFYF